MFAAVYVDAPHKVARLVEGPVPGYKILLPRGGSWSSSGNGAGGTTYGLPRFQEAEFLARFPFATLSLSDPAMPLDVELTGWSPFTPGDADNASLPVAGLEYRFVNPTDAPVDAVFSFHAKNFMSTQTPGDAVRTTRNGFVLWQPGSDDTPWDQGAFSAVIDDPDICVDCAWFRRGWFDARTMVWNNIAAGAAIDNAAYTDGAASEGGVAAVRARARHGHGARPPGHAHGHAPWCFVG